MAKKHISGSALSLLFAGLSSWIIMYVTQLVAMDQESLRSLLPLSLARGMVVGQCFYIGLKFGTIAVADPFITISLSITGNYKWTSALAIAGIETATGVLGAFSAELIHTRYDEKKLLQSLREPDEYENDKSNIMPALPGEYRNTTLTNITTTTVLVRKFPAYFGRPHIVSKDSIFTVITIEFICSFLVAAIVMFVSMSYRTSSTKGAAMVGGILAVCQLCFGPFSGGGINPAYVLASSIAQRKFFEFGWWAYLVSSFLGVGIAVIFSEIYFKIVRPDSMIENFKHEKWLDEESRSSLASFAEVDVRSKTLESGGISPSKIMRRNQLSG